MKNIVLMLVLVAFAAQCQGQISISGVIQDSATSVPLSSAYIQVNGNSHISDDKGQFVIPNVEPGFVEIKVSHVGCNAMVVPVWVMTDTFMVIRLKHHVHAFEEVIAKGKSQSRTLISHKLRNPQLRLRGVSNLADALAEQTGVTFLQTGNAVLKPVIQGMHSSRVSIINDDTKQEGQQWGSEHGPEIDPLSQGNIELIKGAATLKYGNDALGGVIRLTPEEFVDSTYKSATLTSQLLSNPVGGMLSTRLESYDDEKHFGSRLTVGLKRTSDAYSPNYVLTNTAFSQASASLYLNKRIEQREFSFTGSGFIQKFGILASSHIGNLTDLNRAINSDTPLIVRPLSFDITTPYQHIQHYMTKFKYVANNAELGQFTASYTAQANRRKEFDSHGSSDAAALDLNLITHQINLNQAKQTDHWGLQNGFVGEYQQHVYTGRYFIPNYYRFKGGVFSIASYEWEDVVVEAGARYDIQYSSTFRPENGQIENNKFLFNGLSINAGGKWRFE